MKNYIDTNQPTTHALIIATEVGEQTDQGQLSEGCMQLTK